MSVRRGYSGYSLPLSIPRQLATPPMGVFAIRIELPHDVPVQRSQHADTRHHGRAVMLDNQEHRFDCGLPLAEVLFGLGQLLDIFGGILERVELAAAGQRDWIVERALPTPAANGANPSCRIGSGSLRAAAAPRPFQGRYTTDRARRRRRRCRRVRLPMVDRDGFRTPSRSRRTERISWLAKPTLDFRHESPIMFVSAMPKVRANGLVVRPGVCRPATLRVGLLLPSRNSGGRRRLFVRKPGR
jgi:hypothetical protein